MADSVQKRILGQCRNALLGGVPILYIKTDSHILIQKLLLDETYPLVVLLSNGGRKGTEEQRELKYMRPVYELENPQDRQLRYCLNYRNSLPEMDSGGLYRELYASPRDMANERMTGPFLWSVNMPDDPQELKRIYRGLEQYVTAHEDESHPQYPVLQRSVVILYSSQVFLSPMLRTYTEFIDVGYPDEEEIRELIKSESGGDRNLIENEEYLSALCTDFLGFTTEEIVMTMQRIMAASSLQRSDEAEGIIREHKRQKMQGGILEQCDPEGNIGGMNQFRAWLMKQVKPLKYSASYMRKNGTPPPKGVLLCGIPGCGKSEAAKFTAQILNLPLLKMDIGSLMDKYQGVSEQRMRDALKMAEAMAPCVLWIDELEKGFSGAGSNGDSSSFKRMFGYLLGWMQDNQKPCFIFATANDIGGLPKEFFRSGRFDGLYAVYLPTAAECVSIFKSCMERIEKNMARARHCRREEAVIFSPSCYEDNMLRRLVNDTLVLPDKSPRMIIGSDIQKAVNLAMGRLFNETRINGEAWDRALRQVIGSGDFSTFGDGEENRDSIAVSYCRMLRKGFIPTSDHVLFRKEDYHVEFAEEYERLKGMSTVSMSDEELKQHKERLRQFEILQDSGRQFADPYDASVYHFLRNRINQMAALLERRERELLLR